GSSTPSTSARTSAKASGGSRSRPYESPPYHAASPPHVASEPLWPAIVNSSVVRWSFGDWSQRDGPTGSTAQGAKAPSHLYVRVRRVFSTDGVRSRPSAR